MRLRPSTVLPPTTTPPPQPVPRIAPNTTRWPWAAPSVASDRAKQLASFSTRSGRPRAASTSLSKAMPFSQTLLELRTSPVFGEIEPGMPSPTRVLPMPACFSASSTRRATVAMASR